MQCFLVFHYFVLPSCDAVAIVIVAVLVRLLLWVGPLIIYYSWCQMATGQVDLHDVWVNTASLSQYVCMYVCAWSW